MLSCLDVGVEIWYSKLPESTHYRPLSTAVKLAADDPKQDVLYCRNLWDTWGLPERYGSSS